MVALVEVGRKKWSKMITKFGKSLYGDLVAMEHYGAQPGQGLRWEPGDDDSDDDAK